MATIISLKSAFLHYFGQMNHLKRICVVCCIFWRLHAMFGQMNKIPTGLATHWEVPYKPCTGKYSSFTLLSLNGKDPLFTIHMFSFHPSWVSKHPQLHRGPVNTQSPVVHFPQIAQAVSPVLSFVRPGNQV